MNERDVMSFSYEKHLHLHRQGHHEVVPIPTWLSATKSVDRKFPYTVIIAMPQV